MAGLLACLRLDDGKVFTPRRHVIIIHNRIGVTAQKIV